MNATPETHWKAYVPPTFKDIEFGDHYLTGKYARITFDNGYTASIIQTLYSYGGNMGLYEIACMYGNDIVYDTEFSSDVRGWLDESDVTESLSVIFNLPERVNPWGDLT